MPAGAPVVIYARYSTDRQDARSIDDQVRRCRSFAEAHGLRVVEVYSDAAQSGSHLERANMQRLLAAARRGHRCSFRSVLVDDLSRLSRDLGDTWRIVFDDLAIAGISVIDCTTGMPSDSAGARLTYGALALVNDTFLQMVKSETHRGLQGRALTGFWTGGRLYGYSTVVEENPPDPTHPRKVPVVNEQEAAVVRRVFKWYAQDGISVREILRRLHSEGVSAPGAGTKRRTTPGWSQSSVVAMIDNEAYLGRIIWNKRKWSRDRRTGRRHYVERPQSEWIVREDPRLAIVSSDVWNAAQARRAASKARFPGFGTGPRGPGSTPGAPVRHLLSGLLRCGCCDSKMQVYGGKGESRTYACSARRRGTEFCANALTVSKAKVERTIFGGIREELSRPEIVERMTRRLAQRLRDLVPNNDAEAAELERALRKAEAGIANLLALVEQGEATPSPATAERVAQREAEANDLRRRLAEVRARPQVADLVPDAQFVRAQVRALTDVLALDLARGRALLEKHLGSVTLTPKGDGPKPVYRASGRISFDLGAPPKVEQVAGEGFEPSTFGL
jgi:DNA invertase Pin-like site-specific DNA recombinase